jgi:transcriptional regulator GlxA family with amidase domain
METDPKIYHLALLAYPDVQMAAVLGLQDLLHVANINSAKHNGAQLSIQILTSQDITEGNTQHFRSVILPPTLSQNRGVDHTEIHAWLRNQHEKGAMLCSVCAGAFWLGHAGLLEGRPVTTHWLLEDEFQKTFPNVQLNSAHLLIDDHDIVTAGGLMAWLDLGLFIVNQWLGPQVVSETARHLLVDTSGRDQKNYRSFRPQLTHGDPAILSLQHWLESHCAEDISVAIIAQRSNLSERTFLRRFKAATGLTPQSYIQNLRIEKARGMLERTRLSISEISWQVGYQDTSTFSRVFKSITGLKAGIYRSRFGVNL